MAPNSAVRPVGAVLVFRTRFRLPMPADGSDCLCPDCLRKLAEQSTGRCDVTGRWNVSAVLLDMDGTLLDTDRSILTAWSRRSPHMAIPTIPRRCAR